MSEVHDNLADIISDRASGTTDPVSNLTANTTFTAEIDGNPDPVLVLTELGPDAREVTLLHVTSSAEAAGISEGDIVQLKLFGVTTKNQVLRRRNNPANPQVEFWCQKVTSKDS
jgi:hypothetical protein